VSKIVSCAVAARDVVLHVDVTEAFLLASRMGDPYLLVFTWDSYTHYEPMLNRTVAAYVAAYTRACAFFRYVRRPVCLDNKTSTSSPRKASSTSTSPEQAIRRHKNHIICTHCSVHASFPIDLWDRCLPQAELTLNHLRLSRHDRTIYAYQ